jgi:predicted DNA-binding protein YlxM (UPF0122 family)
MVDSMTLRDLEHYNRLYEHYSAALTVKEREYLEMYLVYGYSLSEIASISGISKQAVSKTIRKALRKLDDLEKEIGLLRLLDLIYERCPRADSIVSLWSDKERDTGV